MSIYCNKKIWHISCCSLHFKWNSATTLVRLLLTAQKAWKIFNWLTTLTTIRSHKSTVDRIMSLLNYSKSISMTPHRSSSNSHTNLFAQKFWFFTFQNLFLKKICMHIFSSIMHVWVLIMIRRISAFYFIEIKLLMSISKNRKENEMKGY